MEKERDSTKEKLEQGRVELRLKEEELARNREALKESELRVVKIEAFVSEQEERVKELEVRLQRADQVTEKRESDKKLIFCVSGEGVGPEKTGQGRHQPAGGR